MTTPNTPLAATALDLARWQFGLTTLLHFAVVGVTIGLVVLVAIMQSRWHRTGDEHWLRLTKFYGRAMLIVFGVGVVTGIIQTFQFGMNWAGFSRYVGDVFGAPLALEGLGAFFVESVFLGLWVFGWGRLPRRLHLACLWIVALAAMLSAYAILVANSWMQGPTGYRIVDGRAELTDLRAVMLNADVVLTTSHVLFASLLTGAAVVLAVAATNILRGRDVEAFGRAARLAFVVGAVAGVGSIVAGHFQGVLAGERQPMKIAAAEALYDTSNPAPLSLFAIGPIAADPGAPPVNIEVPGLLSLIDSLSLDAEIRGIDELQRESVQRYGPGNYIPVVPLMYWSFRLMIGAGLALTGLMVLGLWLTRRGRRLSSRWFLRAAVLAVALPFVAQSGGWILREGGRQPWIVQGLLKTSDGASPDVGAVAVATSLGAFLAVYAVIGVIAGRVLRRELAEGLPDADPGELHGGGHGEHRDPGPSRPTGTGDLALPF